MQTGSWLSLQTCPATLLLTNCTVLLAKMPTHTQTGCHALDILGGLSPVPSQSLGLNANALEMCVEAREGHGMLLNGESHWQSGQRSLPERRL